MLARAPGFLEPETRAALVGGKSHMRACMEVYSGFFRPPAPPLPQFAMHRPCGRLGLKTPRPRIDFIPLPTLVGCRSPLWCRLRESHSQDGKQELVAPGPGGICRQRLSAVDSVRPALLVLLRGERPQHGRSRSQPAAHILAGSERQPSPVCQRLPLRQQADGQRCVHLQQRHCLPCQHPHQQLCRGAFHLPGARPPHAIHPSFASILAAAAFSTHQRSPRVQGRARQTILKFARAN